MCWSMICIASTERSETNIGWSPTLAKIRLGSNDWRFGSVRRVGGVEWLACEGFTKALAACVCADIWRGVWFDVLAGCFGWDRIDAGKSSSIGAIRALPVDECIDRDAVG